MNATSTNRQRWLSSLAIGDEVIYIPSLGSQEFEIATVMFRDDGEIAVVCNTSKFGYRIRSVSSATGFAFGKGETSHIKRLTDQEKKRLTRLEMVAFISETSWKGLSTHALGKIRDAILKGKVSLPIICKVYNAILEDVGGGE